MSQLSIVQPVASDNQLANPEFRHISASPINGALGAEIGNVDLASESREGVFEEIRSALLQHKVVVFRDQQLEPATLISIGRRFGELHINPLVGSVDGFPEVMPVRSEDNHEKQFTGLWHSDISWDALPSMGSLLYAVDLPPFGGDTLFANPCLAYASLSPAMQTMLEALNAEHRVDRHHRSKPDHGAIPEDGVIHPVVTRHPETGEQVLFVNEYFTTRFEGMSEQESRPLLDYLYQHMVRPDFTCRIRWTPGTLVFWDNRCTQHYATNDYPGHSRLMHRVTIAGAAPVAAR